MLVRHFHNKILAPELKRIVLYKQRKTTARIFPKDGFSYNLPVRLSSCCLILCFCFATKHNFTWMPSRLIRNQLGRLTGSAQGKTFGKSGGATAWPLPPPTSPEGRKGLRIIEESSRGEGAPRRPGSCRPRLQVRLSSQRSARGALSAAVDLEDGCGCQFLGPRRRGVGVASAVWMLVRKDAGRFSGSSQGCGVCVFVCVRVRGREGERERERKKEATQCAVLQYVHLLLDLFIVCCHYL